MHVSVNVWTRRPFHCSLTWLLLPLPLPPPPPPPTPPAPTHTPPSIHRTPPRPRPSGTGKTLLAKAIAAEGGVRMFTCSGTDFYDVYRCAWGAWAWSWACVPLAAGAV